MSGRRAHGSVPATPARAPARRAVSKPSCCRQVPSARSKRRRHGADGDSSVDQVLLSSRFGCRSSLRLALPLSAEVSLLRAWVASRTRCCRGSLNGLAVKHRPTPGALPPPPPFFRPILSERLRCTWRAPRSSLMRGRATPARPTDTRREEAMPTDACRRHFRCAGPETLLNAQPGDCCVFCSYAAGDCPPVQAKRQVAF